MCKHNWVEVGTDLEMYLNHRNNFVRCLQCNKVKMVHYQSSAPTTIEENI